MTQPATPSAGIFGITAWRGEVPFVSVGRGLLDCPIVGVAVDDWTLDQLVQRARESIEGTGEQLDEAVFIRLSAGLSYVQGDFSVLPPTRVARRSRA